MCIRDSPSYHVISEKTLNRRPKLVLCLGGRTGSIHQESRRFPAIFNGAVEDFIGDFSRQRIAQKVLESRRPGVHEDIAEIVLCPFAVSYTHLRAHETG